MNEKSRVRALKQRIEDLPTGTRRNHMQRAYACVDSITRRLQNMHDGVGSSEDMDRLKQSVRQDAEMVAYLMLNVYVECGGNNATWMACGQSAEAR